MKNKIQALACAAILALGGFNAWTALSGSQETEELILDNIEQLALGEDGFKTQLSWKFLRGRGVLNRNGSGHYTYREFICDWVNYGEVDDPCALPGIKKIQYY